jgi:hypothetical protein
MEVGSYREYSLDALIAIAIVGEFQPVPVGPLPLSRQPGTPD